MIKKKKQLRRAIKIKRFRERHIYHIKPDYNKIKKQYERSIIKKIISHEQD
jgi:hypothetical protein